MPAPPSPRIGLRPVGGTAARLQRHRLRAGGRADGNAARAQRAGELCGERRAGGVWNLWAKWDAAAGATFYRLRWRQPGGQFTAANATTVTDATATITVSDYGEWEAVAASLQRRWLRRRRPGQSANEAPVVRLNLDRHPVDSRGTGPGPGPGSSQGPGPNLHGELGPGGGRVLLHTGLAACRDRIPRIKRRPNRMPPSKPAPPTVLPALADRGLAARPPPRRRDWCGARLTAIR